MTGKMPLHMRNCPSGVPTANTVLSKTAGGVDVTITSVDPQAQRRIVVLAQLHSRLGDPIGVFPAHSSMHGGPGSLVGRCPIIHASTTVTYDIIPDGVTIHVVANNPDDVDKLQIMTEDRVRALSLPSS
jgi:hypothetical protein